MQRLWVACKVACRRLAALAVLVLKWAMHHGKYLSLPTLGNNYVQGFEQCLRWWPTAI